MSRFCHIISYGCQMNVYDSQLIAGILSRHGWEITDNAGRADLILVNTCSVRQHAEDRAWGRLGVLKGLKKQNPGLAIGVCGCMAQRLGTRIRERMPEVDLVIGPDNYREIPSLIGRVGCSLCMSEESYTGLRPLNGRKVGQFVAIMRGCNGYCTYCIVPYVRGRERHRPADDILKEVRALAHSGVKEITLLGQRVNSYHEGERDFVALLGELNELDGIERIRFTTSHPNNLSQDILGRMRDCGKVCEHLHLPLQSGSTKILRRMNRAYSKEEYLELTDRAKSAVPGLSITTDIMVGFPGETDQDFEDTLDVVKRVVFDSAYMFKFSPREGTPAAGFEEQVPDEERGERLRTLIELQTQITKERAQKLVGQTVEVLVEGRSKRNPGESCGRTRANRLVIFPGEDSEGESAYIQISEVRGSTPYGRKVTQSL